MASKKPALGKKVNRATEVMNSPMGKAFMSAQGSDSGKAIGKAAGVVRPPNPPAPDAPAADKGSYKTAMAPNVGKKLKKAMPKSVDTSKKGPAAGGKPVDRQYQGGSGSRKYPTNIPDGYTVLTLMSNPPKYKLVPKSGK